MLILYRLLSFIQASNLLKTAKYFILPVLSVFFMTVIEISGIWIEGSITDFSIYKFISRFILFLFFLNFIALKLFADNMGLNIKNYSLLLVVSVAIIFFNSVYLDSGKNIFLFIVGLFSLISLAPFVNK
jgi:hypothetical protein